MDQPRIKLTRLELVQKIYLAVTIAFSRQRSTATDLLNPRESEAAERKRGAAAHRLAEQLAHEFEVSKHEVTRPALDGEKEAILARLLEVQANRRSS